MVQQASYRILLCVPNVGRRPNNTHRLYTLALPYLQSVCRRAGWDCVLMDAYFENWTSARTSAEILAQGRFDVIGFTLNDDVMWQEAETICAGLDYKPCLIAGGVYASRMSEHILANSNLFQRIFKGEAEAALAQFLTAWPSGLAVSPAHRADSRSDVVQVTPKNYLRGSLDPLGDWRYADFAHTIAPDEYSLVTSRGCTARCNYCVIGPHWSRYGLWRGHSAQWIVNKFLELQALGATHLNIVDDQFVGSPESIERAYEVARMLGAQGVHLPFVFMCRADAVLNHPDLFVQLKAVGLKSVFLGLESGDDAILQKLRKDSSAAQGAQAVAILDAAGIGISAGTIIFHPWTTCATLRTDLAYFRQLLDDHEGFEFYGLNELDLLNGTPIAKLWQGEPDAWHAQWHCAEPAADDVYHAWLRVQTEFLFPLLERLGPDGVSVARRLCCAWMLDTLTCLVNAREAGELKRAYMQISLSCQLLAFKLGVPPVLTKKLQPEAIAERCFG